MPVQKNLTEKNWKGRNYRIIRDFFNKEDREVSEKTGISKQNLSAWANCNANPGSDFIEELSKYFGLPTDVFYKQGLTAEYLKTMGNNTGEQNPSDNKEKHGLEFLDTFRRMVEGETEYLVIPRIIFEGKYRLLPEEELKKNDEALIRKDHQIEGLYEIIKVISSKITNRPPEMEKGEGTSSVG